MTTTTESVRHVVFSKKASGIAIILFDCPGKLNALGTPVMTELRAAMATIEADPSIKACVLMSGKADTFIIGADLFELRKSDRAALAKLVALGHDTLNAGSNQKKPIVIGINGICLGGGLELAMAGHYRIATDVSITRLGLPETRLGLIPGLGGTQRLPRLVGLKQALTMILSAEPISAKEALECGLVDELCQPAELLSRCEAKALQLIEQPDFITRRRRLASPLFRDEAPSKEWPVQDVDAEKGAKLFAMTERSIRIRAKGNYPAQTQVIEVIKTGLSDGLEAGLKLEESTFCALAVGDTSANLIALFLQTDFAKASAASLAAKFEEDNTTKIGIVGGGMMGTEIANVALSHGIATSVKVNAGRSAETAARLDGQGVSVIEDFAELAGSQLIVECVLEDAAIKTEVLKNIENSVSPQCTIASNTSSLSLSELSSALKTNDRFVGLHFFHPVDRMPLVEIISLKTTARKAVARAANFVSKLGKIPLMVKDGPGFLINRLLCCYLCAAARLLQESVPLNWVEEAALDFGMPLGPFDLLDEVGLELAYKIAVTLHEALGPRMQPPGIFESIPRLGLVGKKSGAGVYTYDQTGKRTGVNPSLGEVAVLAADKSDDATRKHLAQRLIFPMIDEASRCLEDRVVMKPREIDMAIVYGIGFPPFRGGLLRYADQVGLANVAKQIAEVNTTQGDPRQVSALINKYIAEGRGFYSRGKDED